MGLIDRFKAVFKPVDETPIPPSRRDSSHDMSNSHDGILYLPPSPRELIEGRLQYECPLIERRVSKEDDQPLAAIYRMYEHLLLDQHIELRNEVESFWFHSEWEVSRIPDPRDLDLERYAVVSSIPLLLVTAFNRRIELGIPRDAPAIFKGDDLEKWKKKGRLYETKPSWSGRAHAIRDPKDYIFIPHWDNDKRGFVPIDPRDPAFYSKISRECFRLGVVVCKPHIHFT